MRFILILIVLGLLTGQGYAQVYIDPVTSGAILSTGSQHNRSLDRTNDQLTLIQRGQLAITGQLTVANDLQNKIFIGLSEVSSAVKTLLGVKEASDLVTQIFENVNKTLVTAQGDPVLLLFAEENARSFHLQSVELSTYVAEAVLKGGKDNLMDAGERAKLMRHIIGELRALRGLSYGMHRSMYYAKMNGVFRSVNPWRTWVNRDAKIATEVVRDFDYLKKK